MKPKETHLVDYLLVLRRRRWVLFSTLILVVISAAVGAYRKPKPTPQYQAVTTLIVKPDRPALVSIRGAQPFYQQYFDEGVDQRTQLRVLMSRSILQRVVNELGLLDQNASLVSEDAIIERIQRSISVDQEPGTYLVRILARENTADKAIQLANTMADVYIEYNLQSKLSSAQKTVEWLNEQIVDLRSKVQKAYAALSEFTTKNDISALEMSPEIQARKLTELSNSYEQARKDQIEAETRLAELRKWQQQHGSSTAEILASINDVVIEKLRTDLMQAEIEHTNLLQTYKEKHPKVKQIELTIQTLRQNLEKEVDTLFKKLETNLAVAQAREQATTDVLTKFKQESRELDNKRIEYTKLRNEVSSTEELYNLLFQQLKETSITNDLEKNNIQILERARAARNITEPIKREQLVGFGVVIGLIMGIGLAFLFEYFDKTIKNPEEVERYLGLPVLGTIPKIDKDYGKPYYAHSSSLSKKKHYALEAGK